MHQFFILDSRINKQKHEMVFPNVTHDNFQPVDPIENDYGLYEYDWPDLAWAAGAGAQFRRDIVRWFRRLPRGQYRILLRVLYNDGGAATVAHGTRKVSAPLTNEDLLEGDGYHAGILPGLEELIEQYEEDEAVIVVQMHIWRGGDDVVLVDDDDDSSSDETDETDGSSSSSRDGARRAGASHRGSTSSRSSLAQRRGGQRRPTPRSSRHVPGTRRVHHHAGSGQDAARLSSLRRCVAIALHASVRTVERLDSGTQRVLALALANRQGLELTGDDELGFLECKCGVRIDVYDADGNRVRESEWAGETVSVLRLGDGAYHYIHDLPKVERRSHACRYCGQGHDSSSAKAHHERARACLKCAKCKAKFDSPEEKRAHESRCDADDCKRVLGEKFAKAPNELWGVYDLESIKGRRVELGVENRRRTAWRQQPVMCNFYFSQSLADQANGGERAWSSEYAATPDELWPQVHAQLEAMESALAKTQKWHNRAAHAASRTIRTRAWLQAPDGAAWLDAWLAKDNEVGQKRKRSSEPRRQYEESTHWRERERLFAEKIDGTEWATRDLATLYEGACGEYDKYYADMVAKYKAENKIVLYAHNGARYDANLVLEGLVQRAPSVEVARSIKFLKSSGGYIEVSLHDGLFLLRDSFKFLNSGLRALVEDFGLEGAKGDYPHEWMSALTWSNEAQRFKPPRCVFTVLAPTPLGPMKHRPSMTMPEGDYASLPGLDPQLPTTVAELRRRMQLAPELSDEAAALVERAMAESDAEQPLHELAYWWWAEWTDEDRAGVSLRGLVDAHGQLASPPLDGPLDSQWHPYQQCSDYCMLDCTLLFQCLEMFRQQVLEATWVNQPPPESHAHAGESGGVVLAIDPGPTNMGVCAMRFVHQRHNDQRHDGVQEVLALDCLRDVGPSPLPTLAEESRLPRDCVDQRVETVDYARACSVLEWLQSLEEAALDDAARESKAWLERLLEQCVPRPDGALADLRVRYKKKKRGRRYAMGGTSKRRSVSMQGCPASLRPLLVSRCRDADLVNAQATILVQKLRQHALLDEATIAPLVDYVANRDDWLEEIIALNLQGLEHADPHRAKQRRKRAKQLLTSIVNGGGTRKWLREKATSSTHRVPERVNALAECMRRVRAAVVACPAWQPIVADVRAARRDDDAFFADEDKLVRSAFAIVCHEWEDEVLTVMDECFRRNGWAVMSLIFDGVLLLDRGPDCSVEAALRQAELAVRERVNLEVRLEEKELFGLADAPVKKLASAYAAHLERTGAAFVPDATPRPPTGAAFDAGKVDAFVATLGVPVDRVLIEMQSGAFAAQDQVEALKAHFGERLGEGKVQMVDAGYKYAFESYVEAKRRHGWYDNKRVSTERASTLLAERHPEWLPRYDTTSKRDDVADAYLLAQWYLDAHGGVCDGACEACACRWHSEGFDMNHSLTLPSLAESIFRMGVSADSEPVRGDKGEWQPGETRRRPWMYAEEHRPARLSPDKETFVRPSVRGGRCECPVRLCKTGSVARQCACHEQAKRVTIRSGPDKDKAFFVCKHGEFGCGFREAAESSEAQVRMHSYDVSSMYAYVQLERAYPVGPGEWMNEEWCHACTLEDEDGVVMGVPHGWDGVLDVDLEYPRYQVLEGGDQREYPQPAPGDEWQHMPVLAERKTLASGSKLVFDCTDKTHYRIASPQLRFALERGYRLKKVHAALRFDMAHVFSDFIRMWQVKKEEQAAYKNQKDPRYNPALYAAIKLMLCSLFGRCTMRNQTDEQALVTSSELGGLLDRAKKHKQALVDLQAVGGGHDWWVATFQKPDSLTKRLPVCYGAFVLSYAQSHLYELMEAIRAGDGICMYMDTDGVACAFPPGCDIANPERWVNQDGAFGCVKDEWPASKYGWPVAFYALGPKTYCADFGDGTERTSLDGRTHVKMKGAGLGGNEHNLGPATFEKLVRKQQTELVLHKFCMDRPKDFRVTATEGTFSLNAELSDKRLDVGYKQWHGCELLVTRPWTGRDFDPDRGHPLCVKPVDPCAICLQPLHKEAPTQLACGHSFHRRCVDRWLATNPTCPMCRDEH